MIEVFYNFNPTSPPLSLIRELLRKTNKKKFNFIYVPDKKIKSWAQTLIFLFLSLRQTLNSCAFFMVEQRMKTRVVPRVRSRTSVVAYILPSILFAVGAGWMK